VWIAPAWFMISGRYEQGIADGLDIMPPSTALPSEGNPRPLRSVARRRRIAGRRGSRTASPGSGEPGRPVRRPAATEPSRWAYGLVPCRYRPELRRLRSRTAWQRPWNDLECPSNRRFRTRREQVRKRRKRESTATRPCLAIFVRRRNELRPARHQEEDVRLKRLKSLSGIW
jgi:hypothetical protein